MLLARATAAKPKKERESGSEDQAQGDGDELEDVARLLHIDVDQLTLDPGVEIGLLVGEDSQTHVGM